MRTLIGVVLSVIVVMSVVSMGHIIFIEGADVNPETLRLLFSVSIVGAIGLVGTLSGDWI